MTTYQQAKQQLKEIAQTARPSFKNDKPAQRQAITDRADMICRELRLTEAQRDRLSNYAGNLHPKD